MLSEEESATIAPGAISSGEPTDVPSLLSELKGGRDAKATLGTMIKINDIVDADEDAVLEDSVAKQVNCLRAPSWRPPIEIPNAGVFSLVEHASRLVCLGHTLSVLWVQFTAQ